VIDSRNFVFNFDKISAKFEVYSIPRKCAYFSYLKVSSLKLHSDKQFFTNAETEN